MAYSRCKLQCEEEEREREEREKERERERHWFQIESSYKSLELFPSVHLEPHSHLTSMQIYLNQSQQKESLIVIPSIQSNIFV